MKERTKTQQDLVKESFKTMYTNLMMNYGQFNSDPECDLFNWLDTNEIRTAVVNSEGSHCKFIWFQEKDRNLTVFDETKRKEIEKNVDDWYLTIREMGCKFDYQIKVNKRNITISVLLTH